MGAQTWKWWSTPPSPSQFSEAYKCLHILIYMIYISTLVPACWSWLFASPSCVNPHQRCDIEHVFSTFAPEIPYWFKGFYSLFFMFCHFWLSGSSVRHCLQNQVHGLWKIAYALYPCTLMFLPVVLLLLCTSGLLPWSPFRHLWFSDPSHVFWLRFSTFL